MNTSITSREWILVSAAAAVGGAVFAAAAAAAFAIAQPQSRCQNQADYVVADEGPGAALKRSRTGVWMRLKRFVGSFQIAGRLHQSCNANDDRSSTSKTKEAIACVCHPSFCESEGRSMRSISPPVVCEDETFKREACRNEMQDGRTDLITMGEKDSASERYANSLSRDYNISNVGNKSDPFDPTKRKGYLSWDDYFMAIAFLSAHRSKDPNRQVGACLVSQDRVILGIGYNGFPRGCSDDELPWAKMSSNGDPLQTKYPYVCHAEVNAILNTNHASAAGQRLYVTLFPCNECAKVIIQAGVAEVVYYIDKNSLSPEFSYVASRRLLSMAGVKVWQHQPTTTQILIEFK